MTPRSNKSTARIRRCSIAAKSRCGRTRPRLLIDRTGSSLPVTCEEVVMHQFRTGPYSGSNVFHDPLLIGRGPLDLFDPSLASREDSERLLREAAERLNEALKSIRSGGAMSTRQQQADSTNIQDASRVLDEAAVMVLDRLAVEGGHATRALLFERCKA